jgi:DNA-directed RNA polymerase specialized sigma24 family protein
MGMREFYNTLSSYGAVSMTICIDEILEQYDAYICALARQNMSNTHIRIRPHLLEEQAGELAQRSRIKLWQALQQRPITNPSAYIRRIVRTEVVSMLRQQLRAVPLSLNEEGETFQGQLLVERSEGMNDPAFEAEQLETIDHYISIVAGAVAKLPPRQQRAMICTLKEQLDSFKSFTEICKHWDINTDSIAWPDGVDELRRLKASISPARKNIRSLMDHTPFSDNLFNEAGLP